MLAVGRAALPRALVPEASWDDARDRALGVPGVATWGVAEVRLADDARVDLGLCLGPGAAARAAARRWVDGPPGGDEALRTWLDRWTTPSDPLARAGYLWVELDQPPGAPTRAFAYAEVGRADPLAVAAALSPLGPGRRRALARLIAGLPAGARVVHVGGLDPRGVPATRLVVAVPVVDVAAWLGRAGWPGDRATLAATLPLARDHSHLAVQIDVAEHPLPGLGLELFHPATGTLDPRWLRLGAALVAEGLAAPDRLAEALAWCTATSPVAAAVHRGGQVKVDLLPGGGRRAKAYLAWAVRDPDG